MSVLRGVPQGSTFGLLKFFSIVCAAPEVSTHSIV